MNGTAFDIIKNNLRNNDVFKKFLKGNICNIEYFEKISEASKTLLNDSFNEDMLNLSARMPLDEALYVDNILNVLKNNGMIPHTNYNKKLFDDYSIKVKNNFIHGNKTTYIFPEEARFIFAMVDILKPEKLAFMGSYYAYWVVWILAVLPQGSELWLMDIDNECQALAYENMALFEESKSVVIHYETNNAIESVKGVKDLDWVILDAEGPKEGPSDPDLIDKAIYYPMLKAAFPNLRKGGLMLAHNILLENTTNSSYIQKKVIWNERMLAKFIPFLNSNFSDFTSFESTEGLGVAIK